MSENRNTSLDHVASGDIVERIRSLRYVHVPVASQLMAEAATEIERLRNGAAAGCETVCPHVRGSVTQHCSLNFTLADEERAAIEVAAKWCETPINPVYSQSSLAAMLASATLRSLLERLQ